MWAGSLGSTPKALRPATATRQHRPAGHSQREHAEQDHRAKQHKLEPAGARGPRERLKHAIHSTANQNNAEASQQPPPERAPHRRSNQAQQPKTDDASPNPEAVPRAVLIENLGFLRRRRNELEYPSAATTTSDVEEATGAVAQSRSIIEAADQLLPNLSFFS